MEEGDQLCPCRLEEEEEGSGGPPEALQLRALGFPSSVSACACPWADFSLFSLADPHRNSRSTLVVPMTAAQGERGEERPPPAAWSGGLGPSHRATQPGPRELVCGLPRAAWVCLGSR